jgi:hypothetical protein
VEVCGGPEALMSEVGNYLFVDPAVSLGLGETGVFNDAEEQLGEDSLFDLGSFSPSYPGSPLAR